MSRLVGFAAVAVAAATAGFAAAPAFGLADLAAPVSAAAVVPVAVVAARRRAALPWPMSVAATGAAWFAVCAALLFHGSGGLGPALSALSATVDGAVNGWARLLDTTLPAPPDPDLLIVPLTATWLAAFTGAEILARTRALLWPLAPAVVAFVCVVVLTAAGPGDATVQAAGLLLVAGLTVVRRRPDFGGAPDRDRAPPRTPGETAASRDGPAGRGPRAGRLPAAVVVTACAIAALAAGAGLTDGAQAYDPREGRTLDVHSYSSLNPLGEVSGWLTDPDRVLFTVRGDRPSAVRLAVLDNFDGWQWTSSDRFVASGGTMPGQPGVPTAPGTVRQQIEIVESIGVHIPAADRPERFEVDAVPGADKVQVGVSPGSGVLIAAGGVTAGLRYTVESRAAPRYPAALLAGLRPATGEDALRLTELPPGMPEEIATLADQAVGDATAPFVRAARLERHLTTGPDFAFDTAAGAGHGYGRLRQFLTSDRRRGTPEQFASTFALAVRTLGMPSRVVVGFGPGVRTAADGRRAVRTGDVQVWAEVEFAGVGWLPFYPTPGERVGGRLDPPAASRGAPPDRDKVIDQVVDAVPTPTPALRVPPTGDGGNPNGWTIAAAAVAAGAGALYLAAAVARPRLLRRRRRAGGPREQVVGAWRDCLDSLRNAGRPVPASATTADVVSMSEVPPAAGLLLEILGAMVDRAAYAPDSQSMATAHAAWECADRIRGELAAVTPRLTRVVSRLRPAAVLTRR
jgi:transglutaminase-like putative cysteine protease